MQPLTTDLLNQITQRLVSALEPEQIILFGSYAYGEPNEDSDIDLLVIVSQSDEPPLSAGASSIQGYEAPAYQPMS